MGNIYKLTQVQQVGSRVDVGLPAGEAFDSSTLHRNSMKSLLHEHDSLALTTPLLLDDEEVICERVGIASYPDHSRHMSRFEKARPKLADFMSDARATRLKPD